MRFSVVSALVFAGALLQAAPTSAGLFDKTGQAGMTFLKVGPVARAAGMADAFTSVSLGPTSAFYNPAGMGFQRGRFESVVSHIQWIAEVGITSASVTAPIGFGGGGPLFTVGVSWLSMDYGTINGTFINKSSSNGQSYDETGNLEPTEMVIGLSLARQFTDKFSLGITAKYVDQTLPWFNTQGSVDLGPTPAFTSEDVGGGVMVFDAGTMYRTGFGSSVVSMSIRNFARTQTYERDGFRPPVTFNIGVSMDMLDLTPSLQEAGHGLLVAFDGAHPPDHPEKLALGAEYSFNKMVFVRGGYSFNNDERGLSLGLGANAKVAGVGVGFDYAYSDFGAGLGTVNYFTLSFGM